MTATVAVSMVVPVVMIALGPPLTVLYSYSSDISARYRPQGMKTKHTKLSPSLAVARWYGEVCVGLHDPACPDSEQGCMKTFARADSSRAQDAAGWGVSRLPHYPALSRADLWLLATH
ncbi:hypothetical protein RRG08_053696 [Elysia crispata]|uniref:Uncharacterized protein n=1 Tax=Elysia crispata TaxID=231223 RepID=A0AAE1DNZ3_9GAST|nr:hypothetical protein RRG08_053696 [Elysia crispata]